MKQLPRIKQYVTGWRLKTIIKMKKNKNEKTPKLESQP